MGHEDIVVHSGYCQLQTPRQWWSSGWAHSNAVRGLVNKVYPPPLLLTRQANYTNKGYRSCIPNGPSNGWVGLLIAQGSKVKPARWARAA
jgi:hypothetical protein